MTAPNEDAVRATRVQTLALAVTILEAQNKPLDPATVQETAEVLWAWAVYDSRPPLGTPELPDPAPSAFNDAFTQGWREWVAAAKGVYPPWEAYAAGFDVGVSVA